MTRTSLALGVIAAWLLAAVQVSSLVKDRLTERVWRSIHLLSFGTLILGTLHAIQAGSDTDNPLVLGIGMSILTAIVLATVVRLVRYGQQRQYTSAGPSSNPEPVRGGPRREPMAATAQSNQRQQQHPGQVQQHPGQVQQQQFQQPQPGRVPQHVQQPGSGGRPMPPPHRRHPNDSGGRPG